MSKQEVMDEIQLSIDKIQKDEDPTVIKDNYALKAFDSKQSDAELKDTVDDMIKKLPLKASQIYDYVFWEMFHEDNPEFMSGLKLKLCLAFGVHLMATYYYFKNIPFGEVVYFGGF